MRTALFLSLLVIACATNELAAADTNQAPRARNAPAATAAPGKKDFESFKIIAQHNIFNPNRTTRGARNAAEGETARPPHTESFTLVGTMLYGDKEYAFFDSSSSSYKKAVKSADSVAGYKITEVTPAGAKLEKDGKTLQLSVGQQMKRPDGGEWSVSAERTPETNSSSATSDTSTNSNDSSSSSGDEDEALKRLMKRREEELKK